MPTGLRFCPSQDLCLTPLAQQMASASPALSAAAEACNNWSRTDQESKVQKHAQVAACYDGTGDHGVCRSALAVILGSDNSVAEASPDPGALTPDTEGEWTHSETFAFDSLDGTTYMLTAKDWYGTLRVRRPPVNQLAAKVRCARACACVRGSHAEPTQTRAPTGLWRAHVRRRPGHPPRVRARRRPRAPAARRRRGPARAPSSPGHDAEAGDRQAQSPVPPPALPGRRLRKGLRRRTDLPLARVGRGVRARVPLRVLAGRGLRPRSVQDLRRGSRGRAEVLRPVQKCYVLLKGVPAQRLATPQARMQHPLVDVKFYHIFEKKL